MLDSMCKNSKNLRCQGDLGCPARRVAIQSSSPQDGGSLSRRTRFPTSLLHLAPVEILLNNKSGIIEPDPDWLGERRVSARDCAFSRLLACIMRGILVMVEAKHGRYCV